MDPGYRTLGLGFTLQEKQDLVDFLRNGLTDPRTVAQSAPFDHPQLLHAEWSSATDPNGYPVTKDPAIQGRPADQLMEIPAVEQDWRQASAHVPGQPAEQSAQLGSGPAEFCGRRSQQYKCVITTRAEAESKAGSSRLTEGVSQMRVNEQATKAFQGSSSHRSAADLRRDGRTEAQWPKPTTPPTPATFRHSRPCRSALTMLGFIEYATVDALCDPVAPSAPLDTTAGVQFTGANVRRRRRQPPTPAACKTSGGWIQVNNDMIRVPAEHGGGLSQHGHDVGRGV